MPNIQSKSSCSYAVGSLTKYKIKNQYNHDHRLMPTNGRSKIWDITLILVLFSYEHEEKNNFVFVGKYGRCRNVYGRVIPS